jgi:phosphatidylserine/phosphatidylglycerophosphate/cardiolipin synthase-like enzyme
MKKIALLVAGAIFASAISTSAAETLINAPYQVCFTPGGSCTNLIVRKIRGAQKSIYVQAYGFSSKQIINALVSAHQRGIEVAIILDKSNVWQKYSGLKTIKHYKISKRIDRKVAIAHNKVMIIDDNSLIFYCTAGTIPLN